MPLAQPWPVMATGSEDSESSSEFNQTVDSFRSFKRPIMMEERPQYPANPRYIDTKRRFTVPSTFETSQHLGVTSSDRLERQPQ